MINDYGSKMETNLYAALAATPAELQASPDLAVGFTAETDSWEVIIQYVESANSLLCVSQFNIETCQFPNG